MSASIDIRLNRQNKTYYENVSELQIFIWRRKYLIDCFCQKDVVQGIVTITTPTSFKHNGITITVDGSVQLHLSGKSVGVFEAFYNSTKVPKILWSVFASFSFSSLWHWLIKRLN